MRLIDTLFRQGHMSERVLVDAIVTGERPRHLDQCDICAERAVQLARWMDDVQRDAAQMADDIFTPERLVAQQGQILKRLEQLDHPARVIAFPAATRLEPAAIGGRRVALAWVGVAAAAGLAIGIIGGQLSARLNQPPTPATTASADNAAEAAGAALNSSLFDEPFESLSIPSLATVDGATPRMVQVSAKSGR